MLTKSVSGSRIHPSSLLRREVARRLDPLRARPAGLAGQGPILMAPAAIPQPAERFAKPGPATGTVIELPRAKVEEPAEAPEAAVPSLPLRPAFMVATGALLSVAWSGWLVWTAAKAALALF